ncbi:zinc finger Y-chromosomal protein 1 [Podospora aff. communis PSN243]|uniref:Zinc finger Y-chromosomal protein 1 n=1 Tax=Podospora aff. communis PSN243 TaxID=3040156 RepID=A0AAV9G9Q6_9PEZI|nr:zinc finger Y-chromosomal protein 1 [Podospora aff. communis PSN243]
MEPSSKRRRLAPKVPDAPSQASLAPAPAQPQQPQAQGPPFPPEQQLPPQQFAPPEPVAPPPQPERHDFEAFARHLQDAAMHIYQQTLKSSHTTVSVLMLRWEEDESVEPDLLALEKVFMERYNYQTDKWTIPSVPNPSIKLGVQIASFLDNARPDHLLIIYYAGHGYLGTDNQLYWASNTREDAAKLKWDGVRCLFEDAQSEILLLIDSCAVRDAPVAGRHGAKQAIAAYPPDEVSLPTGVRSFTATLADSLNRLSTGRPFSAQRLYEEIAAQRQQEAARLLNGANKLPAPRERAPVFFTLTPAKAHGIILVPLEPKGAQLQSPPQFAETDPSWRANQDDRPLNSDEVIELIFDEPRVLVCTTFVGDASPGMASFNHWLHNRPPMAGKITVEGMFLGPPTMLLISMPHSIWNVVQHDKVCCFLGHINSNNMIHLYQRLVKTASKEALPSAPLPAAVPPPAPLPIPSEAAAREPPAREPLPTSPAAPRRNPQTQETPRREENTQAQPAPSRTTPTQAPAAELAPKHEVEESAEMKEAAEQLKALSHVRHEETPPSLGRSETRVGDSIAVRHAGDPGSSPEPTDSGVEDASFGSKFNNTPSSKAKIRKPLQKATPKQETRCTHCSHAPFKDSSSLRKHIAAAHTRPFPCAFSFAGCTSTFGSKNEWKRHIASQHLCLTYYRCSSCPQSSPDGKGNEFNRKDLFTQHLRRMHAPFSIKKALNKGDSKLHAEWDAHVKDMQQSCLVIRRQPPQRSACPKPDCQSVFEGAGSWDEWTEHVGRHMEKGEAARMGVDRMLAKWALEEGIIEKHDDGEYRLVAGEGGGGRDPNGSSFLSDCGKREDEDPSITVAMPILADSMDVD